MKKNAETASKDHSASEKRSFSRRVLPWLGAGIAGLGLSLIPISGLIAQNYPNVFANPLYGTANLSPGFSPNPYQVGVRAGGQTDARALNLGSNCVGYIATSQPDFRLNYRANSSNDSPLNFTVQSSVDTTLLINDPNGNWYCDDDSAGGLNPRVVLNAPRSGQYNVWVGVYNSTTTVNSQLRIAQQPPPPPPPQQTTSLNFCNQTNNPIYTSYVAYDQNNGWQSRGWYRVEAQQCRDVSLQREYRGNVYMYGEYNQGEQYWGGNDASFCVHRTNRFDLPNADRSACNGRDWKRVSMRLFSVRPGQNTWTMTAGNRPDPFDPADPQDNGSTGGGNTGGNTVDGGGTPNCLVYIGDVCVLRL